MFAKGLNLVSKGQFNPLIGAAGLSAFPMAARVVHRVAQEEDFENFLLMHAMGANAAGQVASVVAGGVLLALMARSEVSARCPPKPELHDGMPCLAEAGPTRYRAPCPRG